MAPSQVGDIRFERLALAQGLAYAATNVFYQDSKGFIWFGTSNGLFRYDGYTFVIYDSTWMLAYSSIYEDAHGSLWSNGSGKVCRVDMATENVTHYTFGSRLRAWRKFVDAYGDIWVGTIGEGLARYVRSEDKFRLYKHDPANAGSLCDDTIYAVCVDRKGSLWAGTARGLDKFVDSNGTFVHCEELRTNSVFAILEDRERGLWLATKDDLCRLDESRGLVERHAFEGGPDVFRSTLFQDSKGYLWVKTTGGISCFDRSTGRLERVKSPFRDTTLIAPMYTDEPFLEDHRGRIWAATTAGLALFDWERKVVDILPSDLRDPRALPQSDLVTAMLEDKSGGIWIGMASGGVCMLDRARAPFTHIAQNPYDRIQLTDPYVGAILEDSAGTVWVGTNHGLDRLDLATGVCFHYGEDKEKPGTLGNHRIVAMAEDPPGILWIVGDAGLYMMNKAAGTFRHFSPHPGADRPPFNALSSICIDRSGAIWLGGGDENGHLDLFDRNAFEIARHFYQSYDSRPMGVGVWPISAVHEDRFGVLWFTAGALGVLDRASWRARFYVPNPSSDTTIGSGPTSFCEDAGGTLWIGTWIGLDRFDRAKGTFRHITTKDGLVSGSVLDVLEDNSGTAKGERCPGNLWLLTPLGISRLNPSTDAIRNFTSSDGVQVDAAGLACACYKNRQGYLYFGGRNGFVRFHPDSVHDNTFVPPIVLTAFKKFNVDAELDSAITVKRAITLTYAENVISFEFAALNFTRPEKNQYAYKLEGFDRDWVQCGTRRTVTYTNLDPGSYVFRVKGSNNDGIWNDEGASVILVATPPFWKTWWAYTVYALFVVGLLYGFRRFEHSRLVLKHEVELKEVEARKLTEMDRMKSRFLANISHEFRTPLTLILGPLETARSRIVDNTALHALQVVKRNGQRLLKLVNQLLDLSKLEAGALKLHACRMNIVPLIKGITSSFESSAALNHIDLVFVADQTEIEVYADKDLVEKIFTNLLSNALKFTPEGGEVTVDLTSLTPGADQGVASGHCEERSDEAISSNHRNDTYRPFWSTPGRGGEVLQISVSDTGIGIPPNQIDKIFDRFYQVDSSQTREHEGTGLGLALVKELVDLHHWTIQVHSEVGQGATFTVRLPLGRDYLNDDEIVDGPVSSEPAGIEQMDDSPRGAARRPREEEAHEKAGSEKPIVLVVEDNADVREYIGSYLDALYRVAEASDGAEGISVAIETIPDLIISDLMMPIKDGLELCRVLKNDERTSHIPIILLTARADMKDKVEGLETGADDYLIKPFSPEELLARVKNLIESRRKLRERFTASVLLKPGEVAVAPRDVSFMTKVMAAVYQDISNEGFHVEELAAEMGMSRMQLHRKLTALTAQSPGEFIRYIRLHRAMELLQKDTGTVSEIAYMVGFSDPSYFATSFHRQFGKAPSEISKYRE
jgi:signal transduction histidine kinase/ligand-binding sensor domain-containing protein/DNA-binding response OmpR family regulator